ncbi:hypothetical protein ACP4OV_001966 [Aristida adscensionis]
MASDGHVTATPLLLSSDDSDAMPESATWNIYALACATLASMTTTLMGYNLALMSGAQLFIQEDLGLTDEQVEVLAGSINVFMLVSILAAGWTADTLGRRGTLVLANAFLMAGALAMSLGASYAHLMAARFVTSVGAGFARVIAPVYNAEISPASTRGVLSSLVDIFVNVGILLSYVSNYAFAGMPVHLGWRVMCAAGAIPPVFLAAAVGFMPESPRWLAMRGRYVEAHTVLLGTSGSRAEADLRLEEIKLAVKAPHSGGGAAGGVWKKLLVRPSASVRRIITCAAGLQFFQHAVGTEVIVLYSPLVLKEAGVSSDAAALGATVAMGVVKTFFILVATFLSDRVGRRPLLLASTAGATVAMATLALMLMLTLYAGETSPMRAAASLASLLAFAAAFSIGLGPVVPTYSTEILPLPLRAQGTGLGTAVNRLTSGVVSMTFISLANVITMPGCFLLYASMGVAACVFMHAQIPETRGRSLENMEELFAR